jgi:hypothetical protein
MIMPSEFGSEPKALSGDWISRKGIIAGHQYQLLATGNPGTRGALDMR